MVSIHDDAVSTPALRAKRDFSPLASLVLIVLFFIGILFLSACSTVSTNRRNGPWNLAELSKVPGVTWGGTTGLVQELYYEGEPLQGKPTRIFAYLGRPVNSSVGKQPAMVLVHGGGGKAFKEWAEHWAQRGYVALAMDLAGNGPTGRLADGGPDQADVVKFRNFTATEAQEMWSYHAVAAVVRGHSLLRSLPEVDKERIGITGISWGGYLTCIVAGIDSRFKVAVPVYGCGFLGENSAWKEGSLASMSPESRQLWLELFDPSQYVGKVRYPILFVNGTTDFAYPLDSYQKTYRLVPENWRHVSVAVDRPHGHIWTFPEVDAFASHALRGEPPLPHFDLPTLNREQFSAPIHHVTGAEKAFLCYTTDSGRWQERKWHTVPAQMDGGKVSAQLPRTRPIVAFLALKDDAGRHVSSEHVVFTNSPATVSSVR